MKIALSAAVLAAILFQPAFAQSPFPQRTVKIVVAFAPGGPADTGARIIGQALQKKWGQSVVIENRGGAGGNIGTVAVSKSAPDGYTLLGTTNAFSVNLSYNPNPGYSAADLSPVAVVGVSPNIVVGAPGLKANTLKEALDLARKQPLAYASAGAGTAPHLSAENLFRLIAKVDVRHVPFTGGGPGMAAVSGGHVQLGVMALTPAIPLVKAGKLKAFAVTSAKRSTQMPDVPTIAELGIAEMDDSIWSGIFAPGKTPPDIIAKINADIDDALKQPEIIAQIHKVGLEPVGGSVAATNAYVEAETKKWARVVKETGVRAGAK